MAMHTTPGADQDTWQFMPGIIGHGLLFATELASGYLANWVSSRMLLLRVASGIFTKIRGSNGKVHISVPVRFYVYRLKIILGVECEMFVFLMLKSVGVLSWWWMSVVWFSVVVHVDQ